MAVAGNMIMGVGDSLGDSAQEMRQRLTQVQKRAQAYFDYLIPCGIPTLMTLEGCPKEGRVRRGRPGVHPGPLPEGCLLSREATYIHTYILIHVFLC